MIAVAGSAGDAAGADIEEQFKAPQAANAARGLIGIALEGIAEFMDAWHSIRIAFQFCNDRVEQGFGVDALEQLSEVMPDVILSDIEMPRMDGFDLVRNIRADERLRGLPIIMITSRTADKHRNYALEIGANHYLGKPYQEEELLKLVASYVSAP